MIAKTKSEKWRMDGSLHLSFTIANFHQVHTTILQVLCTPMLSKQTQSTLQTTLPTNAPSYLVKKGRLAC